MYIALQITFFASMLVAVVNVFSLIVPQIPNKSYKSHRRGAHSANFDEKVHKPQSKSYVRIGANMQKNVTHIL